jgi:hypothetical protein
MSQNDFRVAQGTTVLDAVDITRTLILDSRVVEFEYGVH